MRKNETPRRPAKTKFGTNYQLVPHHTPSQNLGSEPKLAWGIHNMIRRPTFFDLGTYSSAPCPRLTKVVKTTLKERKEKEKKIASFIALRLLSF